MRQIRAELSYDFIALGLRLVLQRRSNAGTSMTLACSR
jgi:hypothetical protein